MLPNSILCKFFRFACAGALLAALAACQSVSGWAPPILQPYRPDVPQGNIVTREMVEQLRPGMSREQVRFLLGTPLVTSVFHQDRWDYVYQLKRGNGNNVQTRKMSVRFKDGRLDTFTAEEMPPETLADNLILGRNPQAVPKAPPKEPEPQITIPTK